MENYDEIINELIANKRFEHLTLNEKELVLQHISEEQYNLQRDVILKSSKLLDDEAHYIMPDPEIKANLKTALKARKKTWSIEDVLDVIFGAKVPAYQMAFSIVAIVVAFLWFEKAPEVEVVTEEKIVYQPQVDTIFITQEVPIERIKVVEKIVEVPVKKAKNNNFTTDSDVNISEPTYSVDNTFAYSDEVIEEQQLKSMGNTSLGKEELDQFLVVVN